MNQIIECIPNFSEARKKSVMDKIEIQLSEIPGVQIINRHSDVDHNRTVLTMIGKSEPIAEAGFQCAQLAKQYIDLNHHSGQHPRIGALDVLPFVPLADTEMKVCVNLAHTVGERIAAELDLPVYFYGEAAKKPEHRALENIRRGEYEQLKETIHTNPDKYPDAGTSTIGPAGAIAVGARKPLIAFNVFLKTNNVKLAKAIARKIRFSSGGYPNVKALGLLVDGLAQVSMNFTDYTITNMPLVVETIKLEAQNAGVAIDRSELVGLIPQQAVFNALADYLKLPSLTSDMIIETYCKE